MQKTVYKISDSGKVVDIDYIKQNSYVLKVGNVSYFLKKNGKLEFTSKVHEKI